MKKDLVYEKGISRREILQVLYDVGLPMGVFSLGLYVISTYAEFGTRLITPVSSIMWGFGVVVSILMPGDRREVIRQTVIFCGLYFAAMLALKFILAVVSGVSGEMIAASYDQTIPIVSGNILPGVASNAIWAVSFMYPVGFIAMQGKRLFQFRRTRNKTQAMGRARDIRDTGKKHVRTYRG